MCVFCCLSVVVRRMRKRTQKQQRKSNVKCQNHLRQLHNESRMVFYITRLAMLFALLLLCHTVNSFVSEYSVSSNSVSRRARELHHYSFERITTPSTVNVVNPTTITAYSGTTRARIPSFLKAIPEPGPCPQCSDENGYWDGNVNFVCIACGHEWPVRAEEGSSDNVDGKGDNIVRDCNGNTLESGDTVTLTKELGKGLKKGLKVTRIRVGDYGDGHDVEANISGMGTFALKSQFLKKTSK